MTVLLGVAYTGTPAASPFATEGRPIVNASLATYVSPYGALRAADFTATVDWGDGRKSVGVLTDSGSGGVVVSGSHTFLHAGTYSVHTVLRDAHGNAVSVTTPVSVADAPLTVTRITSTQVTGIPFTAALASFTDANPDGLLSDFSAIVNWGDGGSSPGIVQPAAGGGHLVLGSHAYATTGSHNVLVNISDAGGAQARQGTTITTAAPQNGGGSIAGRLFADWNGNGSADAGEPPLSGWTVYLDANNNGQPDPGEIAALSSASGDYTLADVPAGNWQVRTVVPAGWRATSASPQAVSIASGQVVTGVNFGAVHQPPTVQAIYGYADSPQTLTFHFDEPVTGASGTAIRVTNRSTGAVVTPDQVNYDPGSNALTLSFDLPLANGNYRAVLSAAQITDAAGQHLNGAGTAGTDFVFDFFSLAGDVNHDGTVSFADLLALAQHFGQSGATYAQGDLNNDGQVTFPDLLLAQRFGRSVSDNAMAAATGDGLPVGSSDLLTAARRIAKAKSRPAQ